MAKRVTIRDVAKRAQTSYQTVSRVINNKGDVAPDTRARVLAAINELNYRPNLAARALAQDSERTAIIAVAIPFDSDFLFSNAHLMQMLHGIDREATLHGYSILLSTLRSADDPLSPYQRLLDRQIVDGVIFESGMGDEGAQLLVEKGYPVVVMGYTRHDIPCIHADDEGGAYVLTQHLLALGHRRIGLITGPANTMAVQARWRGFETAMRDAAHDPTGTAFAEGDFATESGYSGAAELFETYPDLTAILAFNDAMALGAVRWLRENDILVPDDVSVAGFDDVPSAEFHSPSLTTVRLSSVESGQRAVQLLLSLLDQRSTNGSKIVMPTHLVVRETTAVPPALEPQEA
ncbi:MAG: LacI family transcriptional regulator [Chloroflexi bacterium]|nr:LacI family transcriptional regulator [Chloroflexota bacterium]